MEYINKIMQKYGTKVGFIKLSQVLLALVLVDVIGTYVRKGWGLEVTLGIILMALIIGTIYMAMKHDYQLVDPVAIFIMACQWALTSIPSVLGTDFFLSSFAMVLGLPVMFLFVMWILKLRKELLPDFDPSVWIVEEVIE